MIVQREGEKTDVPASGEIKKVPQIFDSRILNDISNVIKDKRSREGIGIN